MRGAELIVERDDFYVVSCMPVFLDSVSAIPLEGKSKNPSERTKTLYNISSRNVKIQSFYLFHLQTPQRTAAVYIVIIKRRKSCHISFQRPGIKTYSHPVLASARIRAHLV